MQFLRQAVRDFRAGLFVLSLLATPLLVSAQTSYSNLRGTITDAAGAVVPGADVSVVEPSTGDVARKVQSDRHGNYEVPVLKPGSYRITVSRPGFKNYIAEDVVLDDGQTRRVDAVVQIGSVSETVNVEEGASVIETQTGTISSLITAEQVKNSPLGDSFPSPNAFFATQAGVQSDGGGYGLIVNGQNSNQTTYSLDGAPSDRNGTNIDLMVFVDQTSLDAVNAPADSSRPANFNLTSKRGTNAFHGSVDYKMINNGMNATPHPLTRNDKLILHQGQAEASGPIWRDKTFFYASYYLQRIKQDSFLQTTVPNNALRSGNFAGFGTITDPLTGLPFPGNTIPTSRISSVSNALQNYYPCPIAGCDSAFGINNFSWIHPYPEDAYKFDFLPVVRVDHNLTSKNSFYVRYLPRTSPYVLSSSLPAPFLETIQRNFKELNASDTHVFSNTIVNNARFSWQNATYDIGGTIDGQTPLKGGNVISEIGLQGVNPSNYNLAGFPTINQGSRGMNGSSVDSISEAAGGRRELDNDFSYGDDLSWQKGRHVMKFGGNFQTYSRFVGVVPDYGSFTFNGEFTGNAYADFLLGLPSSDNRSDPLVNRTRTSDELGIYFTDTFKVNPRLTLVYGLRWERYGPQVYTDGLMYRYDTATNTINIPASKASLVSPRYPSNIPLSTSGQVVPKTDLLNFRPRLSFAYDLGNGTVLRGGYGQYTERIDSSYIGLASGAGPFAHLSESYTNTLTANRTPLFSFPNPFPSVSSANPVSSQSVQALPTKFNNGIIHQYNLTAEKEAKNNGFRMSYVGSIGRGLNYNYNGNIQPANDIGYDPDLRPYPIFNSVTLYKHDGKTSYNALETELKRRQGWATFDVNYTWSSSLTDTFYDTNGSLVVENLVGGRRHWSVDPSVRRNMFAATTTWQLPVGRGNKYLGASSRLTDLIVGGWTVQTVSRIGSPTYDQPIFSGFDTANNNYVGEIPDHIPGASPNLPTSERKANRFWNTAVYHQDATSGNYIYDQVGAFMVPGCTVTDPLCLNTANTAPGRYGNACRNCLVTENLFTHHLNVAKDLRATERVNLRYTLSVLNLFNHPHYYDPDTDITQTDVGQNIYAYGADLDFFSDKSGYRKIEMAFSINF